MAISILLLTGKKPADTPGATLQTTQVATKFIDFINGAQKTLDIAIYHFNLKGPQGERVTAALQAATKKGVAVRISFFDDPTHPAASGSARQNGGDQEGASNVKALGSTGARTKSIVGLDVKDLPAGTQPKPIEGGGHLMHSKYMVRDGDTVWMGSANFTNEAWSVQDNNIVVVDGSTALASRYHQDF